jgi:hypothetical protein
MRKAGTHFEQIPLVVVKRIASEVVLPRENVQRGETTALSTSRKRKQSSVPARSSRRKQR